MQDSNGEWVSAGDTIKFLFDGPTTAKLHDVRGELLFSPNKPMPTKWTRNLADLGSIYGRAWTKVEADQ